MQVSSSFTILVYDTDLSYSLTGISGITLAGRLLNVPWAEKLKTRFEKALAEEFTQQDGTIMTIRSELTGFTVSARSYGTNCNSTDVIRVDSRHCRVSL